MVACKAKQGKVLGKSSLRPRECVDEDPWLPTKTPMQYGSEAVATTPAEPGHQLQPSLVGVGSWMGGLCWWAVVCLGPGSFASVPRFCL